MPRARKTARDPRLALARLRVRRERLAYEAELREARKRAKAAKAHADRMAEDAKAAHLARLSARIEAGGFGNRPATHEEAAVRATINDAYADKLGF